MEDSKVRVRTNTLCVKLSREIADIKDETAVTYDYRSENDILDRLNYWELMNWKRMAPNRFPYNWTDFTERQAAERDAFIREGVSDQWAGRQLRMFRECAPMPPSANEDE